MSETPTREVQATAHAVAQYRRRLGGHDDRPLRELAHEIEGLVRRAINEGRVYSRKPEGFILYGEKVRPLPRGQRFCLPEKTSRVGFIVSREDGKDVVVTTISRVGVRR